MEQIGRLVDEDGEGIQLLDQRENKGQIYIGYAQSQKSTPALEWQGSGEKGVNFGYMRDDGD